MKLLVDLNLPFCHFFSLCLLSFIFLHLSSSGSICHFNSTIDFLFQIIHYSKPSEPLSTTTKLQVLIGCSHLLKSLLYNKGQGVVSALYFLSKERYECFFVYCLKSYLKFVFKGSFFACLWAQPSDPSVKINPLFVSFNTSRNHVYQHVMGFVFNFFTNLITIYSVPFSPMCPPYNPSQVPHSQTDSLFFIVIITCIHVCINL